MARFALLNIEQDITRFKVAVNDTAAVGVMDGPRDDGDEFGGYPKWDRLLPVFKPLRKVAAGAVRHSDVADGPRLPGFVDGDEIRVLEPSRRLRSRRKRALNSASNRASGLGTLSATSRPRTGSNARNTNALPPRPRGAGYETGRSGRIIQAPTRAR